MIARTLIVTVALAALAAPAAAETFTMVCTSGGDMSLKSKTFNSTGRNRTRLHFKKAPKGANDEAPKPGHCAWTHCKLNQKERSPASLTRAAVGREAFKSTVTVRAGETSMKYSDPELDRLREYVRQKKKRFSLTVAPYKGLLLIEKIH